MCIWDFNMYPLQDLQWLVDADYKLRELELNGS
jgi:hypothetical protein